MRLNLLLLFILTFTLTTFSHEQVRATAAYANPTLLLAPDLGNGVRVTGWKMISYERTERCSNGLRLASDFPRFFLETIISEESGRGFANIRTVFAHGPTPVPLLASDPVVQLFAICPDRLVIAFYLVDSRGKSMEVPIEYLMRF